MTLSPIQNNYVTKKEFNGLKTFMHEGFDMTNEHIDNLEKKMDTKFTEVNKSINGIREDVSGVKKDISNVREDVSSLKKDISSVKEDISGINKDISSVKEDISDVKKDISSLTKVVNKIAAKIL